MCRLAATLAVAVLSLVVAPALPAIAQDQPTDPSPTLTTAAPAYQRGQTVRVEGTGWPAREVLTVELCGNEAANGSVDCDSRNSTTVASSPDGTMFADVLASSPPSPCPCVVHVFSPGRVDDLAVRVRIEGVPVADVSQATGPVRTLEVTDLDVSITNRRATWFGAAPEGTLRATVTNTGEVAVDRADLRLRWGRRGDATRTVDVDPLDPLEPGEEVVVEVPVRMDPLSYGGYAVVASVAGFDRSMTSTTLSSFPWGLVVLVLLVVGLIVARAMRRRRGRSPSEPEPEVVIDLTDAAVEPAAEPAVVDPDAEPAVVEPAADEIVVVEDDDDARDVVKAGALSARAVAIVVAVVVGTAAIGGGALASCSGDDSRPDLDAEDVCAALREIDPGRAFAGGSAETLAVAAARVHDIEGRVPEAVAGAVGTIAAKVDADDAVLDLPGLDAEDDGYGEAYQAAYALRFDSEVAVAAALLERHGVDECGMEPSGFFDLDAVRDSDLDASAQPVLTQAQMEELRVDFAPAELDGFELEPFEIPEVDFDEDMSQFELDDPEIPRPDLGP